MRKSLLALAVLAALPAMLMAGGPAVGSVAPNFTLQDTAGVSHALYDYQGKVVLLQFWESW